MTTPKLSLSVRAAITYAFSNSASGVKVYALSPGCTDKRTVAKMIELGFAKPAAQDPYGRVTLTDRAIELRRTFRDELRARYKPLEV